MVKNISWNKFFSHNRNPGSKSKQSIASKVSKQSMSCSNRNGSFVVQVDLQYKLISSAKLEIKKC